MSTLAVQTGERISYQLDSYKSAVAALGMVPELSDPAIPVTEKQNLVNSWAEYYGMERGNLLGTNGVSLFDGNDYSDREYFQKSIQGDAWFSTPTVSKITGELSIMVSAPLWQNGVQGGQIAGVVYFVPNENFLNDIMSSIQISENAGAYMLDKDGNTIADTTMDTICNQNIEQEAQGDSSLNALAAMHTQMRQGQTGFGSYRIGGVSKYLAYAPVPGTDSWSLGVTAQTSDFMADTYRNIIIIAVLVVAVVVISILVSLRIANGLGKPIRMCVQRIQQLQEGDLTSPVPEFNRKDEIGLLTEATNQIVSVLRGIIEDLGHLLKEMSQGNLNVRSQRRELYVGDMSAVLTTLQELERGLSQTMSQINSAAEQVSAGAEQVSSGAQALAQGATEQASSVEELSASISEISNRISDTAEFSQKADQLGQEAREIVEKGKEEMRQLLASIQDIAEASNNIESIIKVIDDIAFQTNILALNAAVEAARAGNAGKGFAVVADEVRSLAQKSADAAKETTGLIKNSLQHVSHGEEIAHRTDAAFNDVADAAQNILGMIEKIAQASNEQADAISQISVGIDQISAVVQTNSATSEESAAASEELSGQAGVMKSLLEQFKISQVQCFAPAADTESDRGYAAIGVGNDKY